MDHSARSYHLLLACSRMWGWLAKWLPTKCAADNTLQHVHALIWCMYVHLNVSKYECHVHKRSCKVSACGKQRHTHYIHTHTQRCKEKLRLDSVSKVCSLDQLRAILHDKSQCIWNVLFLNSAGGPITWKCFSAVAKTLHFRQKNDF